MEAAGGVPAQEAGSHSLTLVPEGFASRSVTCAGVNVRYLEKGEGRPLVLVHGLGSSAGMEFRFNLAPLAEHYRVIAPDLPGFGQSEKPNIAYTMDFFIETLETFLFELGISRAAIAGVSFGGRVVLGHAFRRPDSVEKLILIDSLGLGTPRQVIAYRLLLMRGIGELMMTSTATALRRLSPSTVRRFWGWYLHRPQSVEHILTDSRIAAHGTMLASPGYQAAYLATLRSLARRSGLRDGVLLADELHRLPMPVLLVWGRHDGLFPAAHAEAAGRVIPNARVEIFEHTGHTPQLEDPERFNRLVLEFLGEGMAEPGGVEGDQPANAHEDARQEGGQP